MRILDSGRSGYRRQFKDEQACPFCDSREVLNCPTLSSMNWQVLVNRFPYMDGNLMIVPRRHVEVLEGLTEEEWREFGGLLVKVKSVLGRIFKTDSFNVGLNIGPESGASIAHLHWQIIPRRFKNITVMNTFADLYLVTTSPEEVQRLIAAAADSPAI